MTTLFLVCAGCGGTELVRNRTRDGVSPWQCRTCGSTKVTTTTDDPRERKGVTDLGACAGRTYYERGMPVTVERGWRGKGPRNVLIRRADGTRVVRPFRGLRVAR